MALCCQQRRALSRDEKSRRNKRAALKLMRKHLEKCGFVPDTLVTDDLRSYAAAATDLRIADAMSAVDGATIERRTRINQPDDENARARQRPLAQRVCRARSQPP
jgi:transposase-like protein